MELVVRTRIVGPDIWLLAGPAAYTYDVGLQSISPGIERARSVVHLDPINKVLVELGIRRSNSRLDEFDIVGLGRWRSTADLAEGAG
jgi:hypothetical protein